MISSRKLDDLLPEISAKATRLIVLAKAENIDVLITSTYRDIESQNALYAQGRTTPGNIVTNAKGGYSWHNYRVAFDIVPLVNGKPVWSTSGPNLAVWLRLGAIGKTVGLEWAGEWVTFREYPHFQFTNGKSLEELRKAL